MKLVPYGEDEMRAILKYSRDRENCENLPIMTFPVAVLGSHHHGKSETQWKMYTHLFILLMLIHRIINYDHS